MAETSSRFQSYRRFVNQAGAFAVLALLLAAPAVRAQSTSPAFANPEELRDANGKLRAVIILGDADRLVPNLGTKHVRYFQGYVPPAAGKTPVMAPSNLANISPGPTLRAHVGDKVEISFINKVNDANFQYTNNGGDDCDHSSYLNATQQLVKGYPLKDQFPNCFHGSSTANLHFHGTHTSPDALGDNVLIQVINNKDATEAEWSKTFNEIFAMPAIPQKWEELPLDYRTRQEKLLRALGQGIWESDAKQIALGQFPQYIVGAFPNTFPIPDYASGKYAAGQSPGMHWYHAHKHGSTALHILNGLAGAFIIEGPYDQYLQSFYGLGKTYGDRFEKVFVFQMVNPDQNLEKGPAGVNFGGLGPGQVLINGKLTPTISMRPGEIQLWRVLNATPGSAFKAPATPGPGIIGADLFATAGFQFAQTAKDGVQFSPNNYQHQPFLKNLYPLGLMLAGGNRADVLVQAPAVAPAAPVAFKSNGGLVLWVKVEGTPMNMTFPLPTPDTVTPPATTTTTTPAKTAAKPAPAPPAPWPAMPTYLQDLPVPNTEYPHTVTFGWDAEAGRQAAGGGRVNSNIGVGLPPHYTIDNRQFNQFGPLIDQCMPLNGLQEWVLENNTTVIHPFHIHINPFQITQVETPVQAKDANGNLINAVTYQIYTPASDYIWQDVVQIPPGVWLPATATAGPAFSPGKVHIRQHFLDFTGTYVLHCHILAHEDRGMMQMVRVLPADQYPANCQQNIPHHH
jgi:FtsP/CotA-like multicopper oxidase with cupredoxin domain